MRKVDPRKRLAEEQRIIDKMIALHCRDHHQVGGTATVTASAGGATPAKASKKLDDVVLCPSCQELRDYTRDRNAACPFIETRSFCQYCQTHCYRPAMRTRISQAMRYSGPRMILYEPIFAIKHLREQKKQRQKIHNQEDRAVIIDKDCR